MEDTQNNNFAGETQAPQADMQTGIPNQQPMQPVNQPQQPVSGYRASYGQYSAPAPQENHYAPAPAPQENYYNEQPKPVSNQGGYQPQIKMADKEWVESRLGIAANRESHETKTPFNFSSEEIEFVNSHVRGLNRMQAESIIEDFVGNKKVEARKKAMVKEPESQPAVFIKSDVGSVPPVDDDGINFDRVHDIVLNPDKYNKKDAAWAKQKYYEMRATLVEGTTSNMSVPPERINFMLPPTDKETGLPVFDPYAAPVSREGSGGELPRIDLSRIPTTRYN